MSQVLLAGKDWQARALLRAQLLEEGVEVEAYETVAAALKSLDESELLPGLVVADLSASDDPTDDTEKLAPWAKRIPIWIIASRTQIIRSNLRKHGFEMILFRPVDVGELVEQIKLRLEK